jgi:hypothetical protein
MLELLNSPISLAILVSGVVFTVFGSTIGLAWGYKLYTGLVIDILVKEGYVKYRTLDNGEIELIKLNED